MAISEKRVEATFGEQVRAAREERGWSQESLARHLRDTSGIDLHQTAIGRLELGQRAIRLEEAASLARLLGIDLQSVSDDTPRLVDEAEYEAAVAEVLRLRAIETRWEAEVQTAQEALWESQHSERTEGGDARMRRRRLDRAIQEYRARTEGLR